MVNNKDVNMGLDIDRFRSWIPTTIFCFWCIRPLYIFIVTVATFIEKTSGKSSLKKNGIA